MKKIIFIAILSSICGYSFSQETNFYKTFATEREMNFGNRFFTNSFTQSIETPRIYLVKQEYPHIKLNTSLNNEKLKIGSKTFEYGLAVHANSEVKIILPGKAKSFSAMIGKDVNKYSSMAPEQKIVFSVATNNREIWKSAPQILKGEAQKINVPLKGVTEFMLKVNAVGDWNYGHGDWADAVIEMMDGTKFRLDEVGTFSSHMNEIPFSFTLGEKPSDKFLHSWKMKSSQNKMKDRINYTITWTKPEGDFQVRVEAIQFLNHPAIEWKVFYKNIGKTNSQTIKNIRSLDTKITPGDLDIVNEFFGLPAAVKLHYNRGSFPNKYDFEPLTQQLQSKEPFKLTTREGRASERYLPFWNLDYNNCGYITAIGWSGSWEADFDFTWAGHVTKMQAGLANAELFLKPGEEISSPSVCLLYWEGKDPLRGNNLFRRYMKDTWVPKWNGKDPIMVSTPGGFTIAADGFADLEYVNEENQLDLIRKIANTGIDAYWMDAGWYEDGADGRWWSGRGNWFHSKKKFPNGLKPLADEVHKSGMKFILWFDPEAVTKGTDIAKKHPEWVIWAADSLNLHGLYNLSNPTALKYMIDLLDARIKEYSVDVFRTDYNIEPASYWKKNDEKGRRGISEIKYVEGLYKLWDELLKRNPGLLIDNCASGGKRLEYETCKRSVPLWRSDYECLLDSTTTTASQNQNYGLSYFLPVQSTGQIFKTDKYYYRSLTSASLQIGFVRTDINKPIEIPFEDVKKVVSEVKSYNYLFQADFYPLTNYCVGNECWMALQYDSPERGEGLVTIFRRGETGSSETELDLRALDPGAKYTVTFIDSGKELTGTGAEMKKLKIKLNKQESAIIKYKKVKLP